MIKNLLLAEKFEPLGTIGEGKGFGPWAAGTSDPGGTLTKIISNFLAIMTIAAGIWFLFQVILAGYNYLSAGGDRDKIVHAGQKLTNALIGLAIVVAAYALLSLVGTFLGVDFLDINKAISNWVTP